MSLHRKCELDKRGFYLQRGRGVGGVLSSLYSKLLPIAKDVGEKLLSSPEAISTIETVTGSAIDAGLNIILDKAASRNKGRIMKTNLTIAKNEMKEAVKTNVKKAVKRSIGEVLRGGKAKRRGRDVFDDTSLDEESLHH